MQSLAPKNGGTSVSVPALAQAIARTGRYENTLLHFGLTANTSSSELSDLTVLQQPCSRIDLMLPGKSRSLLSDAVRTTDILQIHGLWTGHSHATLRLAVKFAKPAVVSAHGMLDEWALDYKRWKKIPYSILVERPNLSRAACLRALTRVEVANYRSFGLKVPVAIIPNGVSTPNQVNPSEFLDQHPNLEGKKIILFLGRIHKKKGVDLLVRAWLKTASQLPDWHLLIAGPDNGALGSITDQDKLTLTSTSISICGLLSGTMKWSALAAASAFVLPSFSEGLSMATLEALWMGIPILITRECNFREVEGLACTFLIEPSVRSIEVGLVNALTRSADELRERGRSGSTFVRAIYGWKHVGEQMADVYDWLRGGPRPSSVEIHEI